MALDQFFDESSMRNSSFGEENYSALGGWKSISNSMTDSSGGFDCNICLDSVQDPVVTLCGHLFCWPCIYKWLHSQNASAEKPTDRPQQCPVCKSPISHTALVPVYGKGETANPIKDEPENQGIPIPHRPSGPTYSVFHSSSINGSHDRYYHSRMGDYGASFVVPSSTMAMTNMVNPSGGVFGEMVYARAFGNTITNLYVYPNSYNLMGSSSSPRIRRHIMKADKSLNRICIFFFCCLILCLLLF